MNGKLPILCVDIVESGIPPTAVGGSFKASLQTKRLDRFLEYHPRQWVDRSRPAYIAAHPDSVLPSLPSRREGREITKRKGPRGFCCRPHLNDPPTAVGGIPRGFTRSRQWVGFRGFARSREEAIVKVVQSCETRKLEAYAYC